ncbi:MAG: ribose-phosphate pyrophosphokinase [Proteobacteria bacterium]|nr:ribose-phosphate pyrophosphokinase [Pseudomonadota bacterium]NDC25882.1 ribose-phosphate pyrophosphokinase [Pseudomonadota bacterium]NDD05724.1 ribose-phosphate pyrophosphokinase [Pseudomonadota bacterium]NDG26341.1 ribose-phosphate pyrophosphokinase [Pseudomonadota bacterium]
MPSAVHNSGDTFKLFSCSANVPLAKSIADHLGTQLAQAEVRRFSDGEIFVEVHESVRGCDTFVVQPISHPVNDSLMELLIMTDALKRSSCQSITAVMPYYGYARQDRKVQPRVPITAKLVADLLTAAGVDRVIAMDLHASQIQGFFNIPFDHLYAKPVILNHIRQHYDLSKVVVVSPDAGGVERARAYAKRLDCGLAIIDKRRLRPNEAQAMNVIGDVKGRHAVIVDDMIDTAGTLIQATNVLMEKGAETVSAACTHGVFSGTAFERIQDSQLREVICTDTIPLSPQMDKLSKVSCLSVANVLAEAIRRVHMKESVSSLFD